jgi:hypothetical protein
MGGRPDRAEVSWNRHANVEIGALASAGWPLARAVRPVVKCKGANGGTAVLKHDCDIAFNIALDPFIAESDSSTHQTALSHCDLAVGTRDSYERSAISRRSLP